MNHSHVDTFINKSEYDAIISIGNKCPTAMLLSSIGVYGRSFPFDYIPTTPELILKYLNDQTDFYPDKDAIKNKDAVWFGHFNVWDKHDTTIEEFKERFEALFQLLREKKKVLFVYTSEADMYNEFGCRYKDNYGDLKKLRDYINETYEGIEFLILAIHTNKTYDAEANFLHYTINVDQKYMSDNGETHVYHIFIPYRLVLTNLLKKIFQV